MGYPVKQSQTTQPLAFLMIDSTDHITPKTGLSPTVTLSKNGAAFASPAGAVTEIANGWYKVAGNATDTATLGPLLLHATGTGADPMDDVFHVVGYDPMLGTVAIANDGIVEASFAASTAKYQAKIWLFDDDAGSNDRYVVCWFKNGEPIFTGITTPTIQVIKAADGVNLVGSTAMTQIAATGMYRYNEGSNRIINGAAYIAKTQATIDSVTRTWVQQVGRDG